MIKYLNIFFKLKCVILQNCLDACKKDHSRVSDTIFLEANCLMIYNKVIHTGIRIQVNTSENRLTKVEQTQGNTTEHK